jgi:hypothetical protein
VIHVREIHAQQVVNIKIVRRPIATPSFFLQDLDGNDGAKMRLKSRLRPPATDVDTTQTCCVITSGSASFAALTNQGLAAELLEAL